MEPPGRHYSLYVDRNLRRWIIRDREGRFWMLPATGAQWDDREPVHVTEEFQLEAVPGHYCSLLGLPS